MSYAIQAQLSRESRGRRNAGYLYKKRRKTDLCSNEADLIKASYEGLGSWGRRSSSTRHVFWYSHSAQPSP